jgi:hypothetical protein
VLLAEATLPPRASNAKSSKARREASFRFICVLLWVPSQLCGEGWRSSILQRRGIVKIRSKRR